MCSYDKFGDNAILAAAATTESPVDVRVLLRICHEDFASNGHHSQLNDLVRPKTMHTRQRSVASACGPPAETNGAVLTGTDDFSQLQCGCENFSPTMATACNNYIVMTTRGQGPVGMELELLEVSCPDR